MPIQLAIGEYIARMDADDISMPNRFEKQVAFMDGNPEIGLCGSFVEYIPHFENTEGFRKFIDWNNSFFNPDEINLNKFIEIPVINPTILFRKKIAEELGGCWHGNFPEDYEMQLRYLDAGIKMYKLPEVLLEWHDYPTRLTRTDDHYSNEAFFRTKANFFYKWSERNNKFHPTIWIWGAGRKTRKDTRHLEKEGLRIAGYYDINEKKTTIKPCFHYSKLPDPGKIFVVSMVAKYGAREQIKAILLDRSYNEGKDFILMA